MAVLSGCYRAPRSGLTKGILLVHRSGGESLGSQFPGIYCGSHPYLQSSYEDHQISPVRHRVLSEW